jgi:hypothetical protein
LFIEEFTMASCRRNVVLERVGNEESSSPEELLQSLRFLLMRYARSPAPSVAGNVANCLDRLLSHPGFKPPSDERCTYRRMRTYWRLMERLG